MYTQQHSSVIEKTIVFLAFLLLTLSGIRSVAQETIKHFNGKEYVSIGGQWNEYYSKTGQFFPIIGNQLTVKFKPEASVQEITSFTTLYGLQQTGKSSLGYYDFLTASSADPFVVGAQIKSNSLVEYVNITSKKYALGKITDVNGGGGNCTQWYLDLVDAWNITKGSPNVKVAIIDAGIKQNNIDLGMGNSQSGLYSNIFVNSGETGLDNNGNPKQSNGLDDDNNGYVDDYNGWNFYDGNNNTELNYFNFTHGTSVASVVSAKNNNLVIDGVAGGNNAAGVQVIPVKILEQVSNTGNLLVDIDINSGKVDEAIIYAVDMGAKVINMSFSCAPSNDIQAAITYAQTHGVLMVGGAGNEGQGTKAVVYPANLDEVIAVSAQSFESGDLYSSLAFFSSEGLEVDIAARGNNVCVLTTNVNSTTGADWSRGTSYAAPYVSATAALMLSTNSCLSANQIWEIIRNTATKEGAKPNPSSSTPTYFNYSWNTSRPGHSKEFGYGLINTNLAVKVAHYMSFSGKDLFLKDSPEDYGLTDYNQIMDINPNYPFGYDQSPDIWVRNVDDGLLEHQNPEYNSSGDPVWVYVRVRNKGCIPSSVADVINVYWSRAASWTSWPANWDGSDPTKGDLIGSASLGVILPGEEKIFKFPWVLTVPIANNGWKSCVLGRIVSSGDPITDYPNRHDRTVNENNNVAIRNCTIVDIIPNMPPPIINGTLYPHGGYMYISNPLNTSKSYSFKFESPNSSSSNLVQEAEVTLKFEDEEDWNFLLEQGLLNTNGIEQIRDREVRILNPQVTLPNIDFPANKFIKMYVGFSFLSDEMTVNADYIFRVSQTFADSPDQRLGSETFYVKKHQRDVFQADAGPDQIISTSQTATVIAQQIAELATYRWYDVNDSLIYTGSSLQVSPEMSSKYRLEVVANADGFKDYDEVEVKVRKGQIVSAFPVPTSANVTVTYALENVGSAYLMMIQPNTASSNNYLLDVLQDSKTIDMSNYPTGNYTVVLICDGLVGDVINIQKL